MFPSADVDIVSAVFESSQCQLSTATMTLRDMFPPPRATHQRESRDEGSQFKRSQGRSPSKKRSNKSSGRSHRTPSTSPSPPPPEQFRFSVSLCPLYVIYGSYLESMLLLETHVHTPKCTLGCVLIAFRVLRKRSVLAMAAERRNYLSRFCHIILSLALTALTLTSSQGHHYNGLMKQAHAQAAEKIFQTRSSVTSFYSFCRSHSHIINYP